ncbi:MAG TPA: FGLLP motif-containing membrane protein, partial [Candidatus Limnocylindrales bacterium]|nr:FGLLP motif-containing membrane protein [Candidatus Limnocylindrales bacterium]
CQVAHRSDEEFEFFPSSSETGSCGTFLTVGGFTYGPAGGSPTQRPWTAVSQTVDSSRILTVVDIAEIGIRVTETDSYAPGSQAYRTDVVLQNNSQQPVEGVIYRAGDCYLQGADTGYARVDGGAPACIVEPGEGQRIEQWLPITVGSHYYAGFFGTTWQIVGSGEHFPDTCECTTDFKFDNGAGISWSVNLQPGQSATFAHETFFSPVGRVGLDGGQSFVDSVPDPTRISLDPVVVAQSVAVAAGVVLLVPFPSALFNSTLEDNYAEVMGGVARMRAWLRRRSQQARDWIRAQIAQRRTSAAAAPSQQLVEAEQPPMIAPAGVAQAEPRDVWRTLPGMAGFVLLSALMYAFLDPTFGFSAQSLATFAGLAIGLFIVVLAYGIPLMLVARTRTLGFSARALPASLLVAIGCVLISRFTDFQPGYLYGLIIGFFFAVGVDRKQEGRAEAIATASSLAAALVAWVLLAFLRGGAGPSDALTSTLIQAATVTIVVAGLENAVFAMLPLRFMPGSAVFDWDRRVWAALIGLGIFGFAHVLLNPSAGYMADTTRTSFITMVALLAFFALASALFWAYFRFRPARAGAGHAA